MKESSFKRRWKDKDENRQIQPIFLVHLWPSCTAKGQGESGLRSVGRVSSEYEDEKKKKKKDKTFIIS